MSWQNCGRTFAHCKATNPTREGTLNTCAVHVGEERKLLRVFYSARGQSDPTLIASLEEEVSRFPGASWTFHEGVWQEEELASLYSGAIEHVPVTAGVQEAWADAVTRPVQSCLQEVLDTLRMTRNYIACLRKRDITAPEHGVDITISPDGSVVWINVDGVLELRVCQIPELQVVDMRQLPHSPRVH